MSLDDIARQEPEGAPDILGTQGTVSLGGYTTIHTEPYELEPEPEENAPAAEQNGAQR